MTEAYEVKDPFTGNVEQVSNNLVDRLRGKYAVGPTLPNGEPEFGYRQMPAVLIQDEAAAEIVRLRKIEAAARDLMDSSPVGDDDKPYSSDVAGREFDALYHSLQTN